LTPPSPLISSPASASTTPCRVTEGPAVECP
jgi:hypothetical protein